MPGDLPQVRKSSAQFCKGRTLPRVEARDIIQALAFRAVPHLTRELQLGWLSDVISHESGLPVSVSTLRRWWDAKDDDQSVARHMDVLRAKSRSIYANDNAPGRAGGWNPCSAEVVRAA